MDVGFVRYATMLMDQLRDHTSNWMGGLRWQRYLSFNAQWRLPNVLPPRFPFPMSIHHARHPLLSTTIGWAHEYPAIGEVLRHFYAVHLFVEARRRGMAPAAGISSVAWKMVTWAGELGIVTLGVFEMSAQVWNEYRATSLLAPHHNNYRLADIVLEAIQASLVLREPVRLVRRSFTVVVPGRVGRRDEGVARAPRSRSPVETLVIFELRTPSGTLVRELGRWIVRV
ncbi:hypothetical protein FB45DRAFT_1063633 [Roridomyces roridus]|uniref:Uncharacterized protein n=1 Tax=Roridomyces roridus TaxID=1738132 RepID=A0AAD7BD44_9AGAR|nr:hypothetical protein FB45DRAFT_1063633 [Roridomyces roridus]